MRVGRDTTPHRLRDLTVAIALEGDFTAAHVDGDNSLVVATDTMKNTTYALAADHLTGSIEDFAAVLGRHFLEFEQVDRATVNIREHAWRPIDVDGTPGAGRLRPDRGGDAGRDRRGRARRDGGRGRHRGPDRHEDDAIGVLGLSARPVHDAGGDRRPPHGDQGHRDLAAMAPPDVDFDATWEAVRGTLLEVFADHDSPSVQTSIWIMAKAMLERHEELDEVRMVLPNLHHWTVDLDQFGIDNDRLVYVATTEPHGLIEATVRRSAAD